MEKKTRKPLMIVIYHTSADELGRRTFTMRWRDESRDEFNGWRAQVFHADPQPHLQKLKADGYRIRTSKEE